MHAQWANRHADTDANSSCRQDRVDELRLWGQSDVGNSGGGQVRSTRSSKAAPVRRAS